MIIRTLRVHALAADLAASLGAEPILSGPPHSVFEHAINFVTANGALLTLHGPWPLAAPFAIALDSRARDLGRADLSLDLAGAARVDLGVTPALQPVAARGALAHALATTCPGRGAPALESTRGRAARAALARAVRRRDAGDFLDAARALIGLGEGLTPAGDDYLVGTLAILHRLADGWPAAGAVARPLTAHAADATTTVGAAFLRHAVAGQFSEPLCDLAMAKSPAAARAAAAALAGMGATSGADTLAGMRAALDVLAGARA